MTFWIRTAIPLPTSRQNQQGEGDDPSHRVLRGVQRGESASWEGSDYENSDWFWRLVDTVKRWILGEDQVASMNQYTYKFTIEDLNDGAVLSAADIEAKIIVNDHAELLGFYRDGDSSAAEYVDLQTAYETMREENETTSPMSPCTTRHLGSTASGIMLRKTASLLPAEGNALTGSVKGDGTNIFAGQ